MSREPFVKKVIRASAGSGKTHQLTNRYLALLAVGVAPDEILATTFTRKAAGEILDRVLERLAKAAEDAAEAATLAEQIHVKEYTPDKFVSLLRSLLSNLHRVRISTLDSFFIALAGSFSLELGLPTGWSICETADDDDLRRQAIERLLENDDADILTALYQRLTQGQTKRGVQQELSEIVNNLYEIHQETEPDVWNRIVVTDPLPAAKLRDLLARIEAFDLSKNTGMEKPHKEDIGRARSENWKDLFKKGLSGKAFSGEKAFRKKPIPEQLLSLYHELLQHAKSRLIHPIAEQTAATREFLDRFHHELWTLKQTTGGLRFAEVTHALAGGLASEALQPESLAFRLDSSVVHLLLDEFQDTSLSQWRAVEPIAVSIAHTKTPVLARFPDRVTSVEKETFGSTRGQGQESLPQQVRGSFFCVGDVKQAIYGWRGGMAEIFTTLENSLGSLHEEALVESRRSAQPIIDVVNEVFGNLGKYGVADKYQEGLTAWSERFARHKTVRTNIPGYVTLETGPSQNEGEKIAEQRGRHCEYVARKIGDLVQQSPGCSIGVLCRKNDTVARLIYELRRVSVQASEEGGNPLTDSPAVEVILSLYTLADHPGHSVAWFHLLHSPLAEGVGSLFSPGVTQSTSFEGNPLTLPSPPGGEGRVRGDSRPLALSKHLRRDLLSEGYGLFTYKWAKRLAPACDRRDLSRLQQLVEMAYAFEARSTLRADDFVRWVREQRKPAPSAASVRVMTIHAAKGLQFDAVVLPELDSGLTGMTPDFVVGRDAQSLEANFVCRYADQTVQELLTSEESRAFEKDRQQRVEESLSLLYVAMTRAKYALYMCIPGPRDGRSVRKDAWYELLQNTLVLANPGEKGRLTECALLYERGDAQWFEHKECRTALPGRLVPPGKTDLHDRELKSPAQIKFHTGKSERPRGLEHTAPSGREGNAHVSLKGLFEPSEGTGMAAGTLYHAWFEMIDWLDDGAPTDDALRLMAEKIRMDEQSDPWVDLDQKIANFRKWLDNPAINCVLQRSAYVGPNSFGFPTALARIWKKTIKIQQVQQERRFLVRDEQQFWNGSIDRVVWLADCDRTVAADIIDWKTDAIAPGDKKALADRADHYRPQLEAYRRSVANFARLPAKCVAARFVFTFAERIVEI